MIKKLIIFTFFITIKLNCITFGEYTLQNSNNHKLPQNEDRILLEPNTQGTQKFDILMGIFDGHNGYEVSEYAAVSLTTFIRDSLDKMPLCEYSPDEILQHALLALDSYILGNEALKNSGATAIVGCIRDQQLYLANIGDSRAMVVRKNDKPPLITKEHYSSLKPNTPRPVLNDSNYILEHGGFLVYVHKFSINGNDLHQLEEIMSLNSSGKIKTKWLEKLDDGYAIIDETHRMWTNLQPKNQQEFFEKKCTAYRQDTCIGTVERKQHLRLAMTRSLGDYPFKKVGVTAKPDLYSCSTETLDYVLLASDGFWDVVSPENAKILVNIFRHNSNNPNEICRKLAEHARACKSLDDISVVIVFFDGQAAC